MQNTTLEHDALDKISKDEELYFMINFIHGKVANLEKHKDINIIINKNCKEQKTK